MWKTDGTRFSASDQIVVAGDTLPRLFCNAAQQRGDKVFLRQKSFGLWQSVTWRELAGIVREVGMGLIELGFEAGERALDWRHRAGVAVLQILPCCAPAA